MDLEYIIVYGMMAKQEHIPCSFHHFSDIVHQQYIKFSLFHEFGEI